MKKKTLSLKKIFNSAVLGLTMGASASVALLPANIAQADETSEFSQYLESFNSNQCKSLPNLKAPAQLSAHRKPNQVIKKQQELLKSIGIDVSADGYFGNGTRRAIAEFRTIFNIINNKQILNISGVLNNKELLIIEDYSKNIKKYSLKYNLKTSTSAAIFFASKYSGLEYSKLLNSLLSKNPSLTKDIGIKNTDGVFTFNHDNWLYMLKNNGKKYFLSFYSDLIKETIGKNGNVSIGVDNPLILEQVLNLKNNKFISMLILSEYLKEPIKFPKFKNKYTGKFNAELKKQQEALITLGFDLGSKGADGWSGSKTSLASDEFRLLYTSAEYEPNRKLKPNEAKLLFKYAKQAELDETKYNIPSPIVGAIRIASIKNDFNFAYMMELAEAESSFRHNVKSRSSSAKGLYQFIESTWLDMLRKNGKKYGLNTIASTNNPIISSELIRLRSNPRLSALVSVDLQKSNLEKEKCYLKDRQISRTDLYLSHFLGINDSVVFLKNLKRTPNAIAADKFTAAAKYNKYVFYNVKTRKIKHPRSIKNVYNKFGKKFNRGIYKTPVKLAKNKYRHHKVTGKF